MGTSQHDLSLSSWGIPETVLQRYHDNSIRHMFPWQAECLSTGQVLRGGNLVFSAPTSAGKTIVAELLILKRVLETKKKAIMILPFVSVAREKMFYLQTMFQDAGIRVGGFMGGESPPGGLKNIDVAVCTIEKANSLVNRLLEEGTMHLLGILVADEVHMVSNPSRGYLLELLLTKVLYVTKSSRDHTKHNVQIVGMSATLPNLDLLARWLDADLYCTAFRPVPLIERIKIGREILDSSMKKVAEFTPLVTVRGDDDHIISLCLEVIKAGHSVLIFCPTKNWCEKLSETIAREFHNLLNSQTDATASNSGFIRASELASSLDRLKLRDVVEQLRRTPVGLDHMLGRVVPYGVAYHHAGLTFDERDIIEGSFRNATLRVLVATSTLSSGVNLPARRVIIRSPMFHGSLIDTLSYKQMVGRAGRKGVDTSGESILICKPSERSKVCQLMQSDLEAVSSCLVNRNDHGQLTSSLKRAILEIVVSGAASSLADVTIYASCTLLAASMSHDQASGNEAVDGCIEFLVENEFVRLQHVSDANGESEGKFYPTQLGYAVLASSLSPDEGLTVFLELQRARRCFVLDNELHMLYQVTPIYTVDLAANIDWFQYLNLWEALTPDMRRVAQLVGVQESFLARSVSGAVTVRTPQQARTLAIHRRFYTTLILNDLVNETSLVDVARKYGCNKGQLQSLQQSAATFAGMVSVFCARLGWSNLELLLSQFQSRLTFGIQRELCDLVRVSILNGQRARALYNAGYHTLAAVAVADPAHLENCLKNSVPFQSGKQGEQETEWEAARRNQARSIWITGQRGVTEYEAALVVINEAKRLVQQDAGGTKIDWNNRDNRSDSPQDIKGNSSFQLSSGLKSVLRERSRVINIEKRGVDKLNSDKGCESSDFSASVLTPPTFLQEKVDKEKFADVSDSGSISRNCSKRVILDMEPGNYAVSAENISEREINGDDEKTQVGVIYNDGGKQVLGAKCSGLYTPKNSGNIPHQNVADTIEQKDNPKQSDLNEKLSFHENHKDDSANIVCDKDKGVVSYQQDPEMVENSQYHPAVQRGTANNKEFSELEADKSILRKICDSSVDFSQCPMVTDPRWSGSGIISGKNEVVNVLEGLNSESCIDNGANDGVLCSSKCKNQSFNSVGMCRVREDVADVSKEGFNDSFHIDTQLIHLLKNPQRPKHTTETESPTSRSPQDYNESLDFELSVPGASIRSSKKDIYSRQTSHLANLNASCVLVNEHPQKDAGNDSMDLIAASNYDKYNFLDDQIIQDDSFDNSKDCGLFSRSPNSISHTALNRAINSLVDISHISVSPIPNIRPSTEAFNVGEKYNMNISSTPVSHPTNFEVDDTLTFSMLNAMFDCDMKSQFNHKSRQDLYISENHCQPRMVTSNEDVSSEGGLGTQNKITGDFCVNDLGDYSHVGSVLNEIDLNIKSKTHPAPKSKTAKGRDMEILTPLRRSGKKRKSCDMMDFNRDAVMVEDCGADVTGDYVPPTPPDEGSLTGDSPLKSLPHTPIRASIKSCLVTQKRSRKNDDTVLNKLEYSKNTRSSVQKIRADNGAMGFRNSGIRKNVTFLDGDSVDKVCKSSHNTRIRSGKMNGISKAVSCKVILEQSARTLEDEGTRDGNCISDQIDDDSTSRQCLLSSGNLSTTFVDQSQWFTDFATKECPVDDNDEYVTLRLTPTPPLEEDKSDEMLTKPNTSTSREPCASLPASSQRSFAIIDVCSHRDIFESFFTELSTKTQFSLCVSCEKMTHQTCVPVIGAKYACDLTESSMPAGPKYELGVSRTGMAVVGVAVCWEDRDAYYISLTDADVPEGDANESLAAPVRDKSITMETRLERLRTALESTAAIISVFDAKQQYKMLVEACGITIRAAVRDPQIAAWLLDPGGKPPTLHRLVCDFVPEHVHLLEDVGGSAGTGSLGLSTSNPGEGRMRAASEVVVTLHLMNVLNDRLASLALLKSFTNVEAPVQLVIADMELNGIGFSNSEYEKQKTMMQAKLSALEGEAYSMAGHVFSLSSPDDVSQVLYHELRLPPNGDPASSVRPVAANRRAAKRARVKPQMSTSKDILTKLKAYHPLPAVVLEWRRITAALTKVVFPLQRTMVRSVRTRMNRIFGECRLYTATGRVTMNEPNLQNIPRDFEILIPDMIGASPPAKTGSFSRRNTWGNGQNPLTRRQQCHMTKGEDNSSTFSISMRDAFVPFKNGVIVAADYCQLELRMIAHLSRDTKLMSVINSDGDVFRQIAAQWMGVDVEAVTPDQRQNAKQICYGMIYGIGAKALAEQLGVGGDDAAVFIETFKSTYTGMRRYLRDTVQSCRTKGYVETILSRRRYLPDINHTNPHVRAHAERQAVNTTVQGSAADLVKTAMVAIDGELRQAFPTCRFTHRHPHHNPTGDSIETPAHSTNHQLAGGYLILQLHDELIYEVAKDDMKQVAAIIRQGMESAMTLDVKLPVKVKVGPSWGKLEEIDSV